MTRADVDAWADAAEVQLLCADGFDDAILGIGQRFNEYFVVYDRQKAIQILMTRDGMDEEGAIEFFEFNTVGAYIGGEDADGRETNLTPCFVFTAI